MLVAPGAFLIAVGLALLTVGLVVPSGLAVGSLRWQPSFISGILLVTGVQAMIAGFVVSERQRVVLGRLRQHSPRRLSLPAVCLLIGLLIGTAGTGIDVGMLANWLGSGHTFAREVELAAMAQAMIINGVSLVGFGVIYPMLARDSWGTVGSSEDTKDRASGGSSRHAESFGSNKTR